MSSKWCKFNPGPMNPPPPAAPSIYAPGHYREVKIIKMLHNEHAKKKLIILGTTYSGSGAVYDYLQQRGDGYDPFSGSEYLLPQIPYGLMSLRSAIGMSFHHAVANHAIRKFRMVADKLARTPSRTRYGKGYSLIFPNFLPEIDRLIKEATAAELPFHLDWRKAEQSRLARTLEWGFSRLLRYKLRPDKTWMPVFEDKFVSLCREFHDRLFIAPDNISADFILLNQAGSGWNAVASSDFFSRRKVVLVTRDPRDQFAELVTYKMARDVDEFIRWYSAMQQRIALQHTDLLVLGFEDFVLRHKSLAAELCDFAGIDPSLSSSYSADESAHNISKYRSILKPYEIDRIEKKLGKFLRGIH